MIKLLIHTKDKQPFSGIAVSKRIEIAEYLVRSANGSKKFSLRLLPLAFGYFRSSPNHWQQLLNSRL